MIQCPMHTDPSKGAIMTYLKRVSLALALPQVELHDLTFQKLEYGDSISLSLFKPDFIPWSKNTVS